MPNAVLVAVIPIALLAVAVGLAYATVRLEPGSGDLERKRRAEQPLAHRLPYWSFVDDCGTSVAINVDLTYSTFLELQGVDTDCLDDEAVALITGSLHAVIQNLPPGAMLQFVHWTDGDVRDTVRRYAECAGGAGGVGAALVRAKAKQLLRTGGLRRSRLILSISLPNTVQSARARAAGFVKKFPSTTQADHDDALRRLRTLRDQVARGLEAARLHADPLAAAEVRRIVYDLLNPDRAAVSMEGAHVRAPDAAWVPTQSAREQLTLSGITEQRDHLVVGNKLVRVVTLRGLPGATEPALLEGLLVAMPFHCRIHLALEALDSLAVLDQLKRRRDQAHMLATLREKRNQEAEAQEDDVVDLIDKNLRSTVRMVRVALSVVLSVDSRRPDALAVLEKQTAEVLNVVSKLHGGQMMVDEHAQLEEFLATLPGNAAHGRRFRLCTSENAAHLALSWQSWRGADRPLLLLQNGRWNLVGLNPFEGTADKPLDNPNAFMAGSSGSGKSSTTNYLLLNLLAAGAKALIIDVGGSYRRLLEIFGGQYFAVSPEDGVDCALNPFFPHHDIFGEDLEFGSRSQVRLQFIQVVIERMLSEPARPSLRNRERAVLAAAIEQTYRSVPDRTPILEDLIAVLEHLPGADAEDAGIAASLGRDLRVWTKGAAGRLLNRPSTIELTTDCAAFDLKGLEGHKDLQAVVVLILSGVIWNLVMRDNTEAKVVVFDEVWRLLESPASAQLIAELYRTSRKYRCSILTISQSVEDFTSSPIASALINNSATAYLLKHKDGHDVVADQFKLNARERQLFQSLVKQQGEYTEALILHGEHHFLARIVLSALEYWMATTHPPDLAIERDLRARRPGLGRLEQLQLLARQFPNGVRKESESETEAA